MWQNAHIIACTFKLISKTNQLKIYLITWVIMSQHFHIWRDKQKFRVYSQTVYEETSKINAKTLSLNQRQGNQIAYYTKTPGWISSKLTPADVSRSCASFCIWSHCHQNSTVACIGQTFTTYHSTIVQHGPVQKKITHLIVSEKVMLPHSQKYSSA